MVVQRFVNRRGLATDRDPQPGDFRDNVGLGDDPQTRIVSPQPTPVKVGRHRVTRGSKGAAERGALASASLVSLDVFRRACGVALPEVWG